MKLLRQCLIILQAIGNGLQFSALCHADGINITIRNDFFLLPFLFPVQ